MVAETQTNTDAEAVSKAFSEAFEHNSRLRFGLHKNQISELLDSGPVDLVVRSINKTGKWSQKLSETPKRIVPGFKAVYASILSSIQFHLQKAKEQGRDVSQWAEPVLSVTDLRQEFQDTVAIYSLEEWTITEEEAAALLAQFKPRLLLRTLKAVGEFVRTQREKELVFMCQESVLRCLGSALKKGKA